ncbi:MAG TPA: tRNA (adenosine(37)-N6)-threonylcarbamoyltransferase complex ATPase subunit type 1 TsaE [Candidatus Eisenbacteria bacterium]|nr:tRNA (adenosine(37)-N6)-threonylcarbamoyltransferase complex ATPase subunit type 1 TsaE [Candidatus Eisenbacteria bacterium]
MQVEIRSLLRTDGETRALGRYLGSILRAGDWIALRGELGAGKTTLVAGIVDGIHPGMRGRSPTYVLVEIYGEGPRIVHADLYRLARPEEYETLALDDLAAGDAITLVEWADRAESSLPSERLDVELRYLAPEAGAGREIRLTPRGDRWDEAAREGLLDRERWHDALHPGD